MGFDIAVALQNGDREVAGLTDDELQAVYRLAVQRYRAFDPILPDEFFDSILQPEFAHRFPDDKLLTEPEPESKNVFRGNRVRHEIPMLSTEKAYTDEEVEGWVSRIIRAGRELGLSQDAITVRVTPKLDGIAGVINSNGRLLTRGDNGYGFDVSHLFEWGLVCSDRSPGIGEIVVEQKMFELLQREDPSLKHPRNLVGGLLSSDTPNPLALRALRSGKVVFQRYKPLTKWRGPVSRLVPELNNIWECVESTFSFCMTDGLVAEVENKELIDHLGHTSHHHRWQIALKRQGETAETTVRAIELSVGRTGRITPVIHYDPVKLSGAVLSKVTGHSVDRLQKRGINVGAKIRVIRSGEVIPHILDVVSPVDTPFRASDCPSCGHALVEEIDGDDLSLLCANAISCPAQASRSLEHFFKLTRIKGFGNATVRALVDHGFVSLLDVFGMTLHDFQECGLGTKQSENLYRALEGFLKREIDDWLLLAAMGIPHLGRGDARKLLAVHSIDTAAGLSSEQIQEIKGFGPVNSPVIAEGLHASRETLEFLMKWGVRVIPSQRSSKEDSLESPIQGKRIVFSGTMQYGGREDMKTHARALGAQIQSSVNGRTDYLVVGERVGAAKLRKAQELGVTVVHEQEYLEWLRPGTR